MIQIVPSIASADLLNIANELERCKEIGYLHLDIEDGNFSPDITFGMDMVSAIRQNTEAELDAHLMVTNPLNYIIPLCENNVTRIAVHLEAVMYPAQCITIIHQLGRKAGLALNYKTDINQILPYMDEIDYVLLQTCEAGNSNLQFKEYSRNKIRQARQLLPAKVELWADGGITDQLLYELMKDGLDHAVMGRALFGSKSMMELYHAMMARCREDKFYEL